jgi:DNA-binding NarL/FixJ family response regulator
VARQAFTEQQKRIIKILSRGQTASEIATELGLTTAEVETELLAIAKQFGVSRTDRAEPTPALSTTGDLADLAEAG